MKVLHILYQSKPNISGSSTRSQSILVNQKKKGLIPFAISSPAQQATSTLNNNGYELIDGIEFFRTNIFSVSSVGKRSSTIDKAKKIIAFPYFLIKLLLVCYKKKPECIHAHAMFYCGLAGLIASHCFKIPLVYEIRSIWYENSNAKHPSFLLQIAKFLEKFVIVRSNAVVAISSGIKGEYKKIRNNILIIRNGVDCELIVKPLPNKKIKKFAYIGSLIELEGLYGIVEAFAELKKKGYNYEFHIYGDGPLSKSLTEFAGECNSPSFVHGKVENDKINKCYSEIDCIINFRNDEKVARLVTPLKPLEAILFGKPLICSSVSGYREILGGDCYAHFVTPGHLTELIERIIYVADDKNIKDIVDTTRLAQDFIQRERAWSSNIVKYCQIYREVKYGGRL